MFQTIGEMMKRPAVWLIDRMTESNQRAKKRKQHQSEQNPPFSLKVHRKARLTLMDLTKSQGADQGLSAVPMYRYEQRHRGSWR